MNLSPQDLGVLWSVAALYVVLAISPGANFLMITSTATQHSRGLAICTALGVSTGSMVWAGLAAAGLGVILSHFVWVQRVLMWAGGAYLAWVGYKIMRDAAKPLRTASSVEVQGSFSPQAAYWRGLATCMTNPNALLFFSSAFGGLFTPELSRVTAVLAVGVVTAISVAWHLILATAFSSHASRQAYGAAKPVIDRMTGGLLIYFAFKLTLWPVLSPPA